MRAITIVCFLLVLPTAFPEQAVGESLLAELFQPWPERHASPHGTPYRHALNVEPAYLHRGLLFNYRVTNNADGDTDEQEFELHFEWALTKRLGLAIEAPLISLDPVVEDNTTGFGDIAVAGRVLLVDRHRFFLSANIEVETPTGDEDRGLGRGEAALAPTVLWWLDLGCWTVFQGQFGPEIGLESGETELLYRFSLARSWQGPVLCPCRHAHHFGNGGHAAAGHEDHHHSGHDHNDHSHHHPPGLMTAYLESTGTTSLSDAEEGTHFDMTTGIGYGLTEHLELRAGYRFPLYRPEAFDGQFIFSAARCF